MKFWARSTFRAQALETLADPVARKKYDTSLKALATSTSRVNADRSTTRTGSKTTVERSAFFPKAQKEAKEKPQPSGENTSQQTKLLMKIYELLKRLPRDLRQEVISKLFSQQQRLFLEKWMVDMVKTREAHGFPQVALEPAASSTGSTGTVIEQRVALDRSCDTLVLASQPQKCKKQTKVKTAKRAKKSNGLGNIKKDRKSANTYLARICFDSLEIDSKYCDLQSALEYLVILTSIKQKMRESESGPSVAQDFKDRLSEAISSSANDHGKDHADLKLSFSIAICAGAFSGTRGVLRSPRVQNLTELSELHRILDPFRFYSRRGNGCMFQRYSPFQLENAWESLQVAIAKAWKITKTDCTQVLQRFQSLYSSLAGTFKNLFVVFFLLWLHFRGFQKMFPCISPCFCFNIATPSEKKTCSKHFSGLDLGSKPPEWEWIECYLEALTANQFFLMDGSMAISNHFLCRDLVHHPIETTLCYKYYKWSVRGGSSQWM